MANVVRLVNGGSIQVRTGVIQGVGPQGPRGVSGPQGAQGEQGPVGETGAMGAILQSNGLTKVSTNNPLTAATDTLINFGSVQYDQHSGGGTGFANTQFTTPSEGDYLLSCWLRFDDAPATVREIWFSVNGVMRARTSRMAGVGAPFYVDLAFPYRALSAGEVIQVLARSGSTTAVSDGAWSVTRVGSGPQGVPGPIGPQGPVGPQGAAGAEGPAGSANTGFATYADLLP